MNKAEFETKLGSGFHSILENYNRATAMGEYIPRSDFDELREDLKKEATRVFGEWIRSHELTDFSPLEGDDYECYLVPVSALEELEKQ